MKILIALLLFSMSAVADINAQTYSIRQGYNGTLPFWVVVTQSKQFRIDTAEAFKRLKPKWIMSIQVVRDSTAKAKYGPEANKGAILVTIDDRKYPSAYNQLKKHMKLLN